MLDWNLSNLYCNEHVVIKGLSFFDCEKVVGGWNYIFDKSFSCHLP